MKLLELLDITEQRPAEPHRRLTSEPGHVYHATNVEGLYDIAASGYIDIHEPWYGTDQDAWPDGSVEERAYFSQNASAVWSFVPEEGPGAIVRIPQTDANFRRESTGDIYTRERVPVRNAEYLASDGKWYPLASLNESLVEFITTLMNEPGEEPLRTLKNPSVSQLLQFQGNTSAQYVRGLTYGSGDSYWWDAWYAIHWDVAADLKSEYGYDKPLFWYLREQGGKSILIFAKDAGQTTQQAKTHRLTLKLASHPDVIVGAVE